MKRTILILLFITCVGGCATASKTFTSDGKHGYIIDCSGSGGNWSMCYKKAGEICGSKGYEVIEKSGDTGAMITAGQYGLLGSSIVSRSMIIE